MTRNFKFEKFGNIMIFNLTEGRKMFEVDIHNGDIYLEIENGDERICMMVDKEAFKELVKRLNEVLE